MIPDPVTPLRRYVRFTLERLLVRGTFYRLLIIAGAIGLTSVLGGVALHFADGGESGGFADTVWWAFLRISDPGYIGDDQGTGRRVVSTALTVIGMVLFWGALIAVMTQWLNETIRRLELGLTPISLKNHVLVLGWTSRTASILRDLLLSSARMRRFLQRNRIRRLSLVAMAQEVSPQLVARLREYLGSERAANRIILRSGSPLRADHLRRVDLRRASVIILPAEDLDEGGVVGSDTRVIKAIRTIAREVREEAHLPLLVAELYDARRIAVARTAYPGPLEIITGDQIVARILAQAVRHPGATHVFFELLIPSGGNELFAREWPARFVGTTFGALDSILTEAIPIGVVRNENGSSVMELNPPPTLALQSTDQLVFLSLDWAAGVPKTIPPRDNNTAPPEDWLPPMAKFQRVLVLGWSRRVPALIAELCSYRDTQTIIVNLSLTTAEDRRRELLDSPAACYLEFVELMDGDRTLPTTMAALPLDTFDSFLLIADDRLSSIEDVDARTMVGYLVLSELIRAQSLRGEVVVELLDAGNMELLDLQRHEVVVSSWVISHLISQVAMRRELHAAFEQLAGMSETDVHFVRWPEFPGHRKGAVTFLELQQAARRLGLIVLGIRIGADRGNIRGGIILNPNRSTQWDLGDDDSLIVLGPIVRHTFICEDVILPKM